VWKQKGEEYRVHGQWGWLWLSTSRKFKIQDCHKMGLRAGPQKIMVQVKGNEHSIILTLAMGVSEYAAVEGFLCAEVFMF
jgi:nucleosome-remodeling factor subunit BPTF